MIDKAMAEEAEAQRAAAELAASPGMADARGGLLATLEARAVQKAPEPSFRLWPELLAWRKLTRGGGDASPAVREVEKRMIGEASIFASCLGFPAHWRGGLFMIVAPYGEYYWPFVVKAEQYRLWNPPAFQEGRAYALHPCPSGDPAWPHDRDANPYGQEDERAAQWDAGYIIGCHKETTQ